jgi:hypothetical protein
MFTVHLGSRITRPALVALLLLTFPVCISFSQQGQAVTHNRFNDDTNKLQFAIISDLWGGYHEGVFDDAAEKLELMQPQFVMSVGDLIDGKTYDSIVLDNQWSEFNLWVDSLSMPFFYVPGNHDISNPWMELEWQRRHGRSYYYFIQKNVLFMCINTQDGGASGIGPEQTAFFKNAIKDHPGVRWTFVFMHRPVWQGEGEKQEGYEDIEAELSGRNYTLFSGHRHTYLKMIINGMNHYVLGSTGGGEGLRGEIYGEFNHITWVTLNEAGPPKIINIKLDGMIRDNIVNKETLPIINTIIDGLWLTTPTYVSENRFQESVSPVIFFSNPTQYPLTIFGELSNLEGYTVQPGRLDLTIPPLTDRQQVLTIKSANDSIIDLSSLPFIEIELLGSYMHDNIVYEIPALKKMLLTW